MRIGKVAGLEKHLHIKERWTLKAITSISGGEGGRHSWIELSSEGGTCSSLLQARPCQAGRKNSEPGLSGEPGLGPFRAVWIPVTLGEPPCLVLWPFLLSVQESQTPPSQFSGFLRRLQPTLKLSPIPHFAYRSSDLSLICLASPVTDFLRSFCFCFALFQCRILFINGKP